MHNYDHIINELGKQRIKLNEPMSLHTSIKTGGPAGLFFEAKSKEDLIKAVKTATSDEVPYFVIGSGTNLLVSDKGFDGLVIKNKTHAIRIAGMSGKIEKGGKAPGKIFIEAESGVAINQLVRFTIEEGLEGLEYFLGQPGSVGGSVWINSHNLRKKVFIGDYIYRASIITPDGNVISVSKNYFNFGYDESIFQKSRDTIIAVTFLLTPGEKEELWTRGMEESKYRKETQPVLPSFGCTFKNIRKTEAIRLATPDYLTSAGYLIDKAGLKGKTIGGAVISDKHANFILNKGGATSQDVVQLIKLCQDKVKEKFGVELKEEVVYLGEF